MGLGDAASEATMGSPALCNVLMSTDGGNILRWQRRALVRSGTSKGSA